jgi:FkbM family methyltransferase
MGDVMELGHPLSAWTLPHAGSLVADAAGCLVFTDGAARDYHLIRLADPRCLGRRVRLTITWRPAPGGDAQLHVDHWGEITVCRIGRDGQVLARGISESVEVARRADGFLVATVQYFSSTEVVALGSAQARSFYAGDGRAQFIFADIRVEVLDAAVPDAAERLVLVEYGPRLALAHAWRALGPAIRPILIQADSEPVGRLQQDVRGYPDSLVIQAALGEIEGPRVLHVTANRAWSSLLLPDAARLARFSTAPGFALAAQAEVPGRRLASMVAEGSLPAPDVLRIDARGAELAVLAGAEGLPAACLGVEVDSWLSPVYAGQSLLGDVIALLDAQGLDLVKLQPLAGFDAALVACRAFFLARGAPAGAKLALLRNAWLLG